MFALAILSRILQTTEVKQIGLQSAALFLLPFLYIRHIIDDCHSTGILPVVNFGKAVVRKNARLARIFWWLVPASSLLIVVK